MSQSLSKILVHLIYSTKHRAPILIPEVRPKLWEYQAGIFKDLGCPAIEIGGTTDHLHALFEMSRTRELCDVIKDVKKGSSRWLKTQGTAFHHFHWQGVHGAFTMSPIHAAKVRAYILDQANHYREITFQDALLAIASSKMS